MTPADFRRIAEAFPGERIQIDVTYVHDPRRHWRPRDSVESVVWIGDEMLMTDSADAAIAYFRAARTPQCI